MERPPSHQSMDQEWLSMVKPSLSGSRASSEQQRAVPGDRGGLELFTFQFKQLLPTLPSPTGELWPGQRRAQSIRQLLCTSLLCAAMLGHTLSVEATEGGSRARSMNPQGIPALPLHRSGGHEFPLPPRTVCCARSQPHPNLQQATPVGELAPCSVSCSSHCLLLGAGSCRPGAYGHGSWGPPPTGLGSGGLRGP